MRKADKLLARQMRRVAGHFVDGAEARVRENPRFDTLTQKYAYEHPLGRYAILVVASQTEDRRRWHTAWFGKLFNSESNTVAVSYYDWENPSLNRMAVVGDEGKITIHDGQLPDEISRETVMSLGREMTDDDRAFVQSLLATLLELPPTHATS